MTVTDHFYSPIKPVERATARYSIGTESYSPTTTVVRATGELDSSASSDLARALHDASGNETVVLLDLSAVSFMYSGTASVIIDAAAHSEGRLEVFAPTRPTRMILEVLGAATILTNSTC